MGLRETISTPEGKRRYVKRLFATIADRYDFITQFLSYGQDRRWKRRLVRLANPTAADRVLDVACGTGDILFESLRYGPRSAIGLDLTWRMVQLAVQRSSRPQSAGREVATTSPRFVVGDMLALPFPAGAFDVVFTGYGLRNAPKLHQAIREIHRVLVPGGRLAVLDFNRPRNAAIRTVYLTYLTIVGSSLGLVLHGSPNVYRYIPESIRTYAGAAGISRIFESEGFADVRAFPVLFGLMSIHVARRH